MQLRELFFEKINGGRIYQISLRKNGKKKWTEIEAIELIARGRKFFLLVFKLHRRCLDYFLGRK